MMNNKYLAWTSLGLFFLSVGTILFLVLASPVFSNFIEFPVFFTYVISAFSLLATIMGFLSFKAPQAKVGTIGGLILLLLVMVIMPISTEQTILPQPEVSFQDRPDRTGIADIDQIIDTALGENLKDEIQLLQFSTLRCTYEDGLGGPPKCKEGQAEGTIIEVFPFLGPEGHYMYLDDIDKWIGIQATDVYAIYHISPQVYSDKFYPAGEYAVVFFTKQEELLITIQITNGKIVRIDNIFGNPPSIDFERNASEILYRLQK